ncbi:MAG TPA: hypothetical protein VEI47_10615 [Gemmatimonadales bacterium]|nr:hypothetical protein [Gemmatimonadales bacterium]
MKARDTTLGQADIVQWVQTNLQPVGRRLEDLTRALWRDVSEAEPASPYHVGRLSAPEGGSLVPDRPRSWLLLIHQTGRYRG